MLLRSVTVGAVALLTLGARTPLAAQHPIRATIRGTVFDSVSRAPLARALVRLVRADDPSIGRSALTDARGTFTHDTVDAGAWLATFTHPVLDSLRLDPAILRIEITDSSDVVMSLATPSARRLAQIACPNLPTDGALITGSIVDADADAPLVGATVEVEWPEWILAKKQMATELQRRRTQSDSLGRYTLCQVPAGSTLRARSWTARDSAGFVEITVPEDGYAVHDFFIGVRDSSLRTLVTADSTTSAILPRGRAMVRGRVSTSAGAPLPNAIVRVLGSGSGTRTNEAGEFRIVDAVAGSQSIEVRAIGYTPVRRSLRLRTTDEATVTLTMTPRSVELDTVRVVAGREIPWDVRNIERRWRTGLGKFFDARMVMERTTLYTSDALFGLPGVRLSPLSRGYGQSVILRGLNGGECRATILVDGLPMSGPTSIDEMVVPRDVAAIEVYARPTNVPAEYFTGNGCGVVAVWTKWGLSGVPVQPQGASAREARGTRPR